MYDLKWIVIGAICVTSASALGKGYSTILGKNAVHKYCGENDDACMFDTQCCEGFVCSFLGPGYDGKCKLESSESNLASETKQRKCSSNLDCNSDECCKSFQGSGFGWIKYCSKDCSSWTSQQASMWRQNPPVGNYQGYNFWNRWQRRAQLD